MSLDCLSAQGLIKKTQIKNSLKQSIYFRENHHKSQDTRKSMNDKLNSFTPLNRLNKFNSSLPRQNIFFKTYLRIEPVDSFVRSKTEISIKQKLQKLKFGKLSPQNHLNLTETEKMKRKKKDPTLRLIAKTLVFRKSHKYYLYNKNKRISQQKSPQKSKLFETNPKKQTQMVQRQSSDKIQNSKQNKKYKLLQLQGNKINIQQFLGMQSFNNSSIYLKSNQQSYYV